MLKFKIILIFLSYIYPTTQRMCVDSEANRLKRMIKSFKDYLPSIQNFWDQKPDWKHTCAFFFLNNQENKIYEDVDFDFYLDSGYEFDSSDRNRCFQIRVYLSLIESDDYFILWRIIFEKDCLIDIYDSILKKIKISFKKLSKK